MDNLVVPSFAKINLGLNIISKRDDGFHNLETIFYPLRLSDEISIKKSMSFSFESNDKNLLNDNSNLIICAKESLEKFLDEKLEVNIFLSKNIPIGAGLGGGSSNAAATLLGFTKLFDIQISQNELQKIALNLGSDVTFFLNPVPSYAESRGEILTPLNLKINKYILIVNPGIHISTKWAFSLITPKQPQISLKTLVGKNLIDIEEVLDLATNDFENKVFDHYPSIKEIKDKMIEFGAISSKLTGTGSTVWGIFDEEEPAYQTELYFKCKNYFTYIESPI
jgi:4-diphosphocytidyl-2-C-methyl-D-erythritol kinase